MTSTSIPSASSSTATSAVARDTTTSSKPLRRERRQWPKTARVKPPNREKLQRKETAMSATGIGAAVRRKEDLRFVTGKGQYTDDVNRPGQTHIYFIRSPHAHAKLKRIDTKAASAMPGVVAVATGAEFAERKLGGL